MPSTSSTQKGPKSGMGRATRAAKKNQAKTTQSEPKAADLEASTAVTASPAAKSGSSPSEPHEKTSGAVLVVIKMAKYHTSHGARIYHMLFDNGNSHYIRAAELLNFISRDAMEWYEHTLCRTTASFRIDTTETIPLKFRLEIAEKIFPSSPIPQACRKRSCIVCRGEGGYLNFSNGEDEFFKKKREDRENKKKAAEEEKKKAAEEEKKKAAEEEKKKAAEEEKKKAAEEEKKKAAEEEKKAAEEAKKEQEEKDAKCLEIAAQQQQKNDEEKKSKGEKKVNQEKKEVKREKRKRPKKNDDGNHKQKKPKVVPVVEEEADGYETEPLIY